MSDGGEGGWKLLTDLIAERFGLAFPGVRRDILHSRLQGRFAALHLDGALEYYHYLRFHPGRDAELSELTRRITNNESYFFREPQPYDIITAHLVPALATELGRRPLRILSAGCSSGEEPYSLVIALQNAGLELRGYSWEIDACDLNSARLGQAREGVYEPFSLRACDPEARRRYFEETADGRFVLRTRYRRGVRFLDGNLAVEDPRAVWGTYDAVLCRNLLIYFSEAAFHGLIGRFALALRPEGYLFLGHSESLVDKGTEFRPVSRNGTIVYQRAAV